MKITYPKISVITVVYNAAEFLEKTIQSVLVQNYPNLEYIIVDGASKDGTTELIRKYEDRITSWISETDKGIYDAMNKALKLLSGEYVLFLNAGDLFYAPDTLCKLIENCSYSADVYYGDTIIIDRAGKNLGRRRHVLPKSLNFRSFRRGMTVCHQSILIKVSLCRPYDLQYKCSADFDWVLDILSKTTKIHNGNMIIAKFLEGGKSREMMILSWKERYQIMQKHYGLWSAFTAHLYIIFRCVFNLLRDRKLKT